MSSFINSSKHFACIQKSIISLWSQRTSMLEYKIAKIVPELSVNRRSTREVVEAKLTEIMHTIIDIQITCVFLQYRHHYAGKLDQEISETKKQIKTNLNNGKALSMPGLLKAIQCMFYQIELEYLTDLRPLSTEEEVTINFFRTLEKALVYEIATHTSEYENSAWSIDE